MIEGVFNTLGEITKPASSRSKWILGMGFPPKIPMVYTGPAAFGMLSAPARLPSR